MHHSATSVSTEVDPLIGTNDTKTTNGSQENEMAEDSVSSENGPLAVSEHYLVRRYDDSWREYTQPAGSY